MFRLPPLLITLLVLLGHAASAAEVLRSIARIRALSVEEAAQAHPAEIEGTVTFRNPAQPALIADDGREGIYVALAGGPEPEARTGTRVRIEGVTKPGGFLPIVEAKHITILGSGPLPEPRRINPSDFFSPSLDCQWVQVSATITGINGGVAPILDAEISGWTVKLILAPDEHATERVAELLQRPVTVRGVVGSIFNEQRQLTGRHFFVSSLNDITPSETATPDGEPRLRAINELLRSDATLRTRVRVQGVVTHRVGDGLYLRGEGGSIFVRSASSFTAGTRVEAEGFAAIASFRPILRATRVTRLETEAPPQPLALRLTGTDIVEQHGEYVSLDADFLARHDGPGEQTVIQCRKGKWFFEAILPDRSELTTNLAENDRLRLTGICEFTSTDPLPFAKNADGFRIHLPDAAHIVVLKKAPWWNLRRLLWVSSIAGALSLLSLAWVALLRRRVAEQTKIIGNQIERAAVKDERQRIARELHDTIEQELAGLSIQLRNARQRLATAPQQAASAIELAENMLRHCRQETRTSIRDMRSVTLEQRGLHGAMEEMLAPLAAECGARFAFEVRGEPRNLAGPAEIHLLRLAQEAVTNAARHAAALHMQVHLTYAAETVTLEIRDDGRGFDTTAPAPRGHFGMLGIRERANKLHAALTIESTLGVGTIVRVVVPLASAARPNGHHS